MKLVVHKHQSGTLEIIHLKKLQIIKIGQITTTTKYMLNSIFFFGEKMFA
jgi:hypothetical protein